MDLRLLKTFLQVAKFRNMTKAAERLHFSQPAVTAQICSLEDELKVHLFDRSGKRLILTEAGKNFVGYAERLLSLYEEAKNVMTGFESGADTLRLGVSTQMINHFLPKILSKLQSQLPQVFISIEVCMNTQEVLKGVTEYRYDLGFIHGENTMPRLRSHGVWTEEVLWVASPEFVRQHPNIKESPIINYNEGSVFRAKFDDFFKDTVFHSSIEYSDSAAIKQAVLSGLGISYLPKSLVEEEITRGDLVILEQSPSLHLLVSLVYHTQKVFTSPICTLLAIIAELSEADEDIKRLLA